MLTLEKEPDKISILTMPGLNWTFEVQLLHQRDPNWKKERATKKTQFTCVENDRPVYYSATMSMPGRRHGCVRYLERPQFAERAIGHQIIGRYAFANVDDLMQDPTEVFDVAWLDYTGPLTIERMKIIEQFWQRRVRSLLVVTALKARWNQATGKVIARHGSCLDWMSTRLPGHVHHAIEYQNGASSMVQLAVAKVGR